MSMAICHDCGAPVDTDDDPEAFVTVGNMRRMNWEIVVCESCRWLRDEERERQEEMADRATAQAEAIDTATEVYGGVK